MNENDRATWIPQCYDPLDDRTVVWRKLPHWSQPGTLCFITWRTWDSMPAAIVRQWLAERDEWLRRHGVDPSRPDWELALKDWPRPQRQAFRRFVSDRWSDHLDELHGTCPLRRAELAGIVAQSLHHGDGATRGGAEKCLTTEREEHDCLTTEREEHYLSDFVVMPNHVHLLAAFATEEAMLGRCESWKHFTARKINRALGRCGRFWEADAFDHLVRSAEEFEHIRRYIAQNPIAARLSHGEYIHYSREGAASRTPHAPP